MAVDGSIRVETKISNTEAKKDIDDFVKMAKSAKKHIENISKGSSVKINTASAEKSMQKLENDIERYQQKLNELKAGKLGKYEAEVTSTKNNTDEMLNRSGSDEQTQRILEMESVTLEQIRQKYSSVIAKAEELENKIELARQKQAQLNSSAEQTANSERKAADNVAKNNTVSKSVLSTMNRLKNTIGRVATTAGGKLLNGFKNAGNSAKKHLHAALEKIHTKMKGINSDSTKMGKVFARMGLALIGVEGVFTGVRQIVSSALNSNQQLQNQITAIKGILGQSIAPIINFLVSGLGQIVAFADRLYQIFTGTSLVAKYNASAMAQAAENTAGAADSAKEYKRQLAGFDEMNKLSSNDTASSSGAGSGADAPALFETPDINSWLAGIISQIKAGDWEGVGTTIAEGINSAIEKINWNNIQNKVNAFSNNLGKSANAFMGALDWENVGNTIGEALNTVTGAIATFVDTTDWRLLGSGIATSLNGLVDSINAEDLAKTLTAKFKIAIDSLYGFIFGSGGNSGFNFKNLGKKIGEVINEGVKNLDLGKAGKALSGALKGLIDTITSILEMVDWQEIGRKVADFVANVDWSGILNSLSRGLGAALGGLGALLWGLIQDAWDEAVNWWYENAFEDGEFTISGLLEGIGSALKNIGTWIKTNIFDPFITGFKNAFGIHSPATSMEEPGENIIYGVFEGIKSIMANVDEWLKTNVFDKFTSAWKNFEALKVELVGDIKQTFKDAKSKFDSVKSKTSTLTTAVKNSQLITNLKSTYDKIKNKTVTITANAKDKASAIFKNIANSLIDFINKAINKINSKLRISIPSSLQKILSAVGVSVPTGSYQLFSIPNIPRLAKGGIVNNPGRGVDINAGEAGKEAILPLERNTEWMDTLAQKVSFGSITIPIYLDGKLIAKYIIDLQSRKAFELNKGGAY